MKSKNKTLILSGIFIVVFIIIFWFYFFKPKTMNDIYDEPNFAGVVTEVYDLSILVTVDADQNEYKSSDKMFVSLNTKLKDSMTHFEVGNYVRVYYDGLIAETYPAQINNVYAITLISDKAPATN